MLEIATNTANVITDPSEFFETRVKDSTVRQPGIIILIAGLINLVPGLLLTGRLTDAVSGFGSDVVAVFQIIGSMMGIVLLFGLWLVYAGAFYLLSMPFDGEGDFRRLFKLTGWGFIPLVIKNLFSAGTTWYILKQLPSDYSLETYQAYVSSSPAIMTLQLISLALLIWQAFIWLFAVHHGRNLGFKEATIVVSVPTFVNALWIAKNLF